LAVDVIWEVTVSSVGAEDQSRVTVSAEGNTTGTDVVVGTGRWAWVVAVVSGGAVKLAGGHHGEIVVTSTGRCC